jgi:hypothetical protein
MKMPMLVWVVIILQLFAFSSAAQADETAEECVSFQWIPEATHPCTITRMTRSEFDERFGPAGLPPLYPEPLVIVDSARNLHFRNLTSLEFMLDNLPPDFGVTLSSSNSFSEHRRTIPLQQYISETVQQQETLPTQLSNETWYLFGETYSPEWKQFLQDYDVPPCRACTRPDLVALAFGIGNRGSGVQWHVHGPGFSEAVVGRKHWVLYKDRPDFHPDQTSRNWMEYSYTQMEVGERPLECTLGEGDLVYFPNMWWHATINLDPYTAFVSTFTQEHTFAKEEKAMLG